MATHEIDLAVCPVCLAGDLNVKAFTSKRGFMSEPGYVHSSCRGCGSYFVNPQPTPESLMAFYQSIATEQTVEGKIAHEAASRILDKERRRYFEQHRVEPINSRIERGSQVFDAGCGVGAFVKAMRDRGHDARGSDLSRVSVETGRRLLGLTESVLQVGDLYSMPDTQYDVITAWTTIEHLSDPARFLELCNAHLKVDGYLVVEFPTVDSLMFDHLGEDFFWVMPPYHLFLFSLDGMEKLLRRAGFAVNAIYPMPNNWYWFDSIAQSAEVSGPEIDRIRFAAQAFVHKLDKLLDEIAYSLKRSSTVQAICQKVESTHDVDIALT